MCQRAAVVHPSDKAGVTPVSLGKSTRKPFFVSAANGLAWTTAMYILGITCLIVGPAMFAEVQGLSARVCAVVGIALWTLVYLSTLYWLLFCQEHPESSAAIMAEDAAPLQVPSTGGEGRSACVVGGGVSGLALAHNFLQAGFAKVVLLEGRNVVGGNNEPYFDDKQEHATTCAPGLTLCYNTRHCVCACTIFTVA